MSGPERRPGRSPDRSPDLAPAGQTELAPPREPLSVTAPEAGQKLLQFLLRRFAIPEALAHKWIRSGQVRLNGKRTKPFARLAEGDAVRVPPQAWEEAESPHTSAQAIPAPLQTDGSTLNTDFARKQHCQGEDKLREGRRAKNIFPEGGSKGHHAPWPPEASPLNIPIIYSDEHLLVLAKPHGLAVQPGTGHTDCVTARLGAAFAGAPFLPTPAHRLDVDTSGLLLVARSYACLRALHEAFKSRDGVRKEYLAWVAGRWPGEVGEAVRLEDELSAAKVADNSGMERIERAEGGKTALADAVLIRRLDLPENACGQGAEASLLRIRLHTGRTHQIRVQLSSRGHPVLGDKKYGGRAALQKLPGKGLRSKEYTAPPLYLHAARLILTGEGLLADKEFSCLPDWPEPFSVGEKDL